MSKILITDTYLTNACNAIRRKNGTSTLYKVSQMEAAIDAIPMKEDAEWHQCPQVVRNYLSNVDYANVAYTQSSISSYAPSTPVPATNTKPIGKTIDGVTYYNEVPGIRTPFASTNKAGTLKPLDQVRWINTSATNNFRDLGGWACDGGTVKYGLLYRCGNPGMADEELITKTLGIRTEIDLTADGVPAFGDCMRYVCAPTYAMYTLGNTSAWTINIGAVFEAVKYGEPLIFHCSMGADRTGTLACILLGLLGVSQSDIDKDYELTSFYSIRARNGNYQGGTSDWAHLMSEIATLNGNTFRDKCVTFVASLGFTIAEINAFRTAMINGTPSIVTAPMAIVNGTYTHCSTSNINATTEMFQPYTSTIIPDSNYTLTDAIVTVAMGGVDITSTAYSGGVISITSVTGDIVINIEAASSDTRIELFDYSTATINVRFNSSGATTALNGNFVTDFIPVGSLDNTEPFRIYIKEVGNNSMFRASGGNEQIVFIKSDKTIINNNYGRLTINTSTTGTNTLCKHDDSSGGVYIDINQTGDGNYIPSTFFDLSQVAYIRLCMHYSSSALTSTSQLANVSIKADKITS